MNRDKNIISFIFILTTEYRKNQIKESEEIKMRKIRFDKVCTSVGAFVIGWVAGDIACKGIEAGCKKASKAYKNHKTRENIKKDIKSDMGSVLQPLVSQGVIDAMVKTREEALESFVVSITKEQLFLQSIIGDSDASGLREFAWVFKDDIILNINDISKDEERRNSVMKAITEYYKLKKQYLNGKSTSTKETESEEDINEDINSDETINEEEDVFLDDLNITITPPDEEETNERKDEEVPEEEPLGEYHDNETEERITEENEGEKN